MKRKIKIQDISFAHTPTSASYERIPKYLEWDRSLPAHDEWCVYTNFNARLRPHNPEKSIAWIYESPALLGDLYAAPNLLKSRFKYIITNYKGLQQSDQVQYFNTHATFIDTNWNGYYTPNTNKTELCSMICSEKAMTDGHCFRQRLAKFLQQEIPELHGYGRYFNNHIDKKVDALAKYKYTIVVENGIYAGYYSEKLTDAIYCETVPIYFGDPSMSNLPCVINGFEWLKSPQFSEEIYQQKYAAIKATRNPSYLDAMEDRLYLDHLSKML